MAREGNSASGVSPLAGKPATKDMLIDVGKLERNYFEVRPDVNDPNQLVSFGTSGHRGSPFQATFTEAHILAITQAICDYRQAKGIDGPLYMGKDAHAISGPAQGTALEVLAGNNVETVIQRDDGVTPTPVISRMILVYNRGRKDPFRRRHRHHVLPQPSSGRRFQVQSAERRACRHRRHRVDSEPREQPSLHRKCRSEAHAILLAGVRIGHHRRQSGYGSDFFVHDRGSRWRDSYGLLQPLRDGATGEPEGRISRGLCK